MTCEHLRPLEQAIIASGARETFSGRAWSLNCREWVYFDCYIDADRVSRAFHLPSSVSIHFHRGTHDGQERGFVCSDCHDAIMGRYEPAAGTFTFRG